MELFSYSFAVTMLHSIWQTGALLLFYYLYMGIFPKTHPLLKRNLLFSLLAVQLAGSIITFTIYYTNSLESVSNSLLQFVTGSIIEQSFIRDYADYFLYAYTDYYGANFLKLLILLLCPVSRFFGAEF